jgi:hypothetical protein
MSFQQVSPDEVPPSAVKALGIWLKRNDSPLLNRATTKHAPVPPLVGADGDQTIDLQVVEQSFEARVLPRGIEGAPLKHRGMAGRIGIALEKCAKTEKNRAISRSE